MFEARSWRRETVKVLPNDALTCVHGMSRWVWLFWVFALLLLIFLKNRQAVLLLPQQSASAGRVASSPCKQAIMEDIAASYATEGSNPRLAEPRQNPRIAEPRQVCASRV